MLNPDFSDMLSAFAAENVPVLGRKALIRNKKAVGRPEALADVAQLENQPAT